MTPGTTPGMGTGLWIVAAGIVGLVAGSFINVVILRLPRMLETRWCRTTAKIRDKRSPDNANAELSLTWPPSACPHCDARLKPWHNVPVISFVALRGRCHQCRHTISLQYPLVELMAAVFGIVAILHFGATPAALGATVLGWLLLPAAIIDARTGLLPDHLTLTTLWLGLLASLGYSVGLSSIAPAAAIAGASVGYGALWTLDRAFYLVTGQRGMGHGDFKLTAALGAWLGATSLPWVLFLAACFGLAISATLALAGRPDRARQIPLGPWLALGGWINLLYGPWFIDAYSHAIGLH
ncbi:prepilin peptidase [Salinisphaera orenii]|uniref:prepilin peptidase n=1 Tax=Salinisphaera orenii TaxID=856731 RepID=UPI000DBE7B1F